MPEAKKGRVTAVLLAAGVGSRMNSEKTKQTILLCGESVLHRCVRAFERAPSVDDIVVVCRADEVSFAKAETADFAKVSSVVVGGRSRAESAKIGFLASGADGVVLIHDVARCLITVADIEAVTDSALKYGAASSAGYVTDTVKEVDSYGKISKTVPRERLLTVQTPQAFSAELYEHALQSADLESITDDNMLLERIGVSVHPVITSKYNIKITTKEDLAFAEYLIKKQESSGG